MPIRPLEVSEVFPLFAPSTRRTRSRGLRCAWFAVCLWIAGCSAPPPRLTVVTWNVHHGRGLDGRVDAARIADALRALEPDLVAIQEVDVGVERSGRIDLAAEIAGQLGMYHAFGKNLDYQGGDYGNAILSRFPILAHDNHHYHMLREGEQRGVLTVRVDAPFGEVVVMNTHLDYRPDDAERRTCVVELERLAGGLEAALVLACGDFNDTPGSAVHTALRGSFFDAWSMLGAGADDGASFPSITPTKRIDWVLLDRRHGWRAESGRVIPTEASDHAIVVFDVAPAGSSAVDRSSRGASQ